VDSGDLAIQQLKKHAFDFILLDLQMPVMNGYDTSIIIKNKQLSEAPIIAFSAVISLEEKLKIKESGMSGFAEKPINIHALFITLYQFLAIKNTPSYP
jgi:CheY-like chemotaxis protein